MADDKKEEQEAIIRTAIQKALVLLKDAGVKAEICPVWGYGGRYLSIAMSNVDPSVVLAEVR